MRWRRNHCRTQSVPIGDVGGSHRERPPAGSSDKEGLTGSSVLDTSHFPQTQEEREIMPTRFLLGALAFVCALAFVVPAQAVTINGVDYTLFAKTTIKMEEGNT